MPVSASKLVTLAQLQVQAERVKQELAKYTLASELGSLAKKSEISEADLSAALKSVIDGKMDAADSMTTEAINSAIATAIAKSAHARFEKVEKVPSNDEAQDNVLYLVMNAATGYYDIYAKVGEEVVRLDDTTVDLSNYATIEQLNAVSGGIGGTVYAGTKVAAAAYSAATLNAGSYQYGPATAVVATNFKVERITNAATTQVVSVAAASLTAGSDNNGGAGFVIGDAGGDNAVSSLKYRVTATHGAGVTAKDNLGAASSPAVAIAAGTKTKDTAAYTPFRNVFYGASTGKPALDSAAIRALGKTGKAYAAGTLTINVPVGAQRVAIACIATAKGVTKVINETAMNADVTSTFVKSVVPVEGANSYAAKDYNVWVFEPAVAYGNAAVLKVTLG